MLILIQKHVRHILINGAEPMAGTQSTLKEHFPCFFQHPPQRIIALQTLPLNELIERRHSLLFFLAFLSIMRLSHYSFVTFLVDCDVTNSPSHFQNTFL